jgi:hypothetical protein
MPLYEFEGKGPVVDAQAFVHPLAVLIGDVTIVANGLNSCERKVGRPCPHSKLLKPGEFSQ